MISAVAPAGAFTWVGSSGENTVTHSAGCASPGPAAGPPSSSGVKSSVCGGGLGWRSPGVVNRPVSKAHQPPMAIAVSSVTMMNIAAQGRRRRTSSTGASTVSVPARDSARSAPPSEWARSAPPSEPASEGAVGRGSVRGRSTIGSRATGCGAAGLGSTTGSGAESSSSSAAGSSAAGRSSSAGGVSAGAALAGMNSDSIERTRFLKPSLRRTTSSSGMSGLAASARLSAAKAER